MSYHRITGLNNNDNLRTSALTPVVACDQPLYAIAKQLQWTYPDQYGSDKMFIMFGGLHIEMAALKTIGHWLTGSGWCEALVQAGITTEGVAESLLSASHLKRTRYAHQVTAAALFVLQKRAFNNSQDDVSTADFDGWCRRMSKHPQFHFWTTTLEIELIILMLVRSFRTSDFPLYIHALQQLLPWFFALDRTNYARWLSIHVQDLLTLPTSLPELLKQFQAGKFTVTKTSNPFSAMSIDQAHEQTNKIIKGDGGLFGVTDQSISTQRWLLAAPEIASFIQSYEEQHGMAKTDRKRHHENTSSFETKFEKDVEALISSIEQLGCPFEDDGEDLVSLGSKLIVESSACETVRNIKDIGTHQYHTYVRERLDTDAKKVMDPIKRNRFHIFKYNLPKPSSSPISVLKSDCALFSRLYIACQTRDGDLDTFFRYENQPFPPSLADSSGKMRHGTKSDIIGCLEEGIVCPHNPPRTSTIIFDGAAVVQMIKPKTGETFANYSSDTFGPYILNHLQKSTRIDVVFDEYHVDSLKSQTRESRGIGVRQRVTLNSPVPRNWQKFLRMDENKRELFSLLSRQLVQNASEISGEVYATIGETVLCSVSTDLTTLMPCSHEEADTRIMVHCKDAVTKGHNSVTIRTVDSDVICIAVSNHEGIGADELWIAFGTGKKFRYLPIHEIVHTIGPTKSRSLAFFHAFTGCDTVSSFGGHGKKMAFDVWHAFPDVTLAFLCLGTNPSEISEQQLDILERYLVLLYDRTSYLDKV